MLKTADKTADRSRLKIIYLLSKHSEQKHVNNRITVNNFPNIGIAGFNTNILASKGFLIISPRRFQTILQQTVEVFHLTPILYDCQLMLRLKATISVEMVGSKRRYARRTVNID